MWFMPSLDCASFEWIDWGSDFEIPLRTSSEKELEREVQEASARKIKYC
jgi:hypothetical protein